METTWQTGLGRRLSLAALAGLAMMIVHAANLTDSFISDDWVALHELRAATISQVLSGETLAGAPAWRPWSTALLWAEWRVFGLWPTGYHLVSLVLGALTAMLFFLLADSLFGRRTSLPALAAFLLAPGAVENLAWISGRADVLAVFFLLAALLLHVWGRRGDRRLGIVLGAAVYALALGAKGAALAGPLLVLLVDRHLPEPPAWRRTAAVAGAWAGLAVVWVLIADALVGERGAPIAVGLFMLRDLLRYAQLFFFPLGMEEAIPWVIHNKIHLVIFLLLLAAALVVLIRRVRNRWMREFEFPRRELAGWPVARLGLAGGFAALLPAAHLFPSRLHLFSASIWFSLAVAGALTALLASPRVIVQRLALGGFAAWLALCLGVGIDQAATWRAAARLANRVVHDLAEQPWPAEAESLALVLTVPDTLRGAFVMRNGLHQAVQMLRPSRRIVVHHLALVGLSDKAAAGLRVERAENGAFIIRQTGATMHDYVLPPDAARSLAPEASRVIGPAGYLALERSKPFCLDALEVAVDPRLLNRSNTYIFVFRNGRLRPFTEGEIP